MMWALGVWRLYRSELRLVRVKRGSDCPKKGSGKGLIPLAMEKISVNTYAQARRFTSEMCTQYGIFFSTSSVLAQARRYTSEMYTRLNKTTPHHTLLSYTTLHYAKLRYATPYYSTQHNTTQHSTTPHHTTPFILNVHTQYDWGDQGDKTEIPAFQQL